MATKPKEDVPVIAPPIAKPAPPKVEAHEVSLEDLTVLVQEQLAHVLYTRCAFGPLQQADFFNKVTALFSAPMAEEEEA